jgi:hypothetical protein
MTCACMYLVFESQGKVSCGLREAPHLDEAQTPALVRRRVGRLDRENKAQVVHGGRELPHAPAAGEDRDHELVC